MIAPKAGGGGGGTGGGSAGGGAGIGGGGGGGAATAPLLQLQLQPHGLPGGQPPLMTEFDRNPARRMTFLFPRNSEAALVLPAERARRSAASRYDGIVSHYSATEKHIPSLHGDNAQILEH